MSEDAVDLETLLGWRGRTVCETGGEKIGKLGALYLDAQTQRPAYAGIHTGLFGRHEAIVPLTELVERDGVLEVPFTAESVKDAPQLDPDATLTPEEEEVLHAYYGTAAPAGTVRPEQEGETIRSEEEVVAQPGPMRPAERVRLRKVLVTDHVQQTVPVRKEVVQLETEPTPDAPVEPGRDVPDR